MLIVVESIVTCFVILILCVVGIANGPIGLVTLYEKDVKERVIELGLTTEKQIKKSTIIYSVAFLVPMFILVPWMVYFINGARTFWDIFWQITIIILAEGLFDRLFIDWYWVGHTKAWIIPGTEDLMPYIPKKTVIKKWISTIVTYPIFAAIVAWIIVSL